MRKLNCHRDDDSLEVMGQPESKLRAVFPGLLISADTSQTELQTLTSRPLATNEADIAHFEQVLMSFRSKARRFHAQHGQSLDQTPASSLPTVKTRPYRYIRAIWRLCKALVVIAVLWICIVGQPIKLVEGLYQGFVYGWSSQCQDGFKCGK